MGKINQKKNTNVENTKTTHAIIKIMSKLKRTVAPTNLEIRLSKNQSPKPSSPGLFAPTNLFQGWKKVLRITPTEKLFKRYLKKAPRKINIFLSPPSTTSQ
jgi:hypothetical protein